MSSEPIDVDKLINAVKTRPPLYSRNERFEPGYTQKKKQLWLEVCKELNPNYRTLSATEKREYDHEIYKRWRSLRTCFTRELALQRKEKLEQSTKRRKRYEHYDALSFMMGEYNDDRGTSPVEAVRILQFESDEDTQEFGDVEETSRSENGTFQEIKSEIEMDNYQETEIVFHTPNPIRETVQQDLDTLANISIRHESDSDKLFMLSLIPSFRRIQPKKKLAVKIELMKVLQSFQDDE